MPSKAYDNFKKNSKQVDKLLKAFTDMRPPTRGRKHLDHFTRAAIVFLCSSWEVYVEQIALESGKIISSRMNTPSDLPVVIQKTISLVVKNAKHDLEPVRLAVDWKDYYHKIIEKYIANLNTPKNAQVTELFHKYIGIDGNKLKAKVPLLADINKIVTTRGDIAHNIFSEDYVKKELVEQYYDTIRNLTKQIDLYLWDYIPEITNGKRPWQNTY